MDVPSIGDLLNLRGRVALVTGAGGTIGTAVARRLAQAGADVAVHYWSSGESAARTAKEVEAAGVRCVVLKADVSDPDQVEDLFRRCTNELGPTTVLINNAGVYPTTPLLAMDPGEWDEVVRVNLYGTHYCTQAGGRRMIEAGEEGSIVNISSIEGEAPMPGHAHYNAAKAGVAMYTRTAAAELGGHGIRVNAVSPGLIRREGLEDDWPEGVASWRSGCPLGRLGEPDDIADACLFLASAASRWITGATIRVDGGFLSRGVM